jgi:NADH-quinone oxidoreductase subunit N
MLIQCYILVSYGVIKLASTDEYFLPKMHILAISVVLTTMYLVYNSIESYNEVIDRNAHDTLIELFVLSITLSVFVFTYNYNKSTGLLSFEYYVVMLICTFSFCTFIHASDIMLMYVLVELQSICSYVLTAINRNNRFAVEAGIKYFIIGSLSSILLLLGFSFLYGFPGLIGISDLATYLRFVYAMNDYFFTYTMVMSLIFVNVGFLFKIYSAPFHF